MKSAWNGVWSTVRIMSFLCYVIIIVVVNNYYEYYHHHHQNPQFQTQSSFLSILLKLCTNHLGSGVRYLTLNESRLNPCNLPMELRTHWALCLTSPQTSPYFCAHTHMHHLFHISDSRVSGPLTLLLLCEPPLCGSPCLQHPTFAHIQVLIHSLPSFNNHLRSTCSL